MKTLSGNPLKKLLRAACLGFCFALPGAPAAAADNVLMDKPVQLVIPFAPGGLTDLIARLIQPQLTEQLGRSVVVNNRPGAGGVVATNYVANAKPDGHTLFLSWDSHTINSIAIKDLPYNIFEDFEPVTLMVRLPLIMGAWAGLPTQDLDGLIKLAKQEPRKYNFASIGVGSSNRLHAELLNSLAGVEIVHIPYAGGGPAINAIRTGEVAYGFFSHGALRSFLETEQIRPLAVTGSERLEVLPDTPTLQESGFDGFEAYSWVGIYTPAGTPEPVIRELNRAFKTVLNDPRILERLHNMSVEVVASSPEELRDFEKQDFQKWLDFTKQRNIQFD